MLLAGRPPSGVVDDSAPAAAAAAAAAAAPSPPPMPTPESGPAAPVLPSDDDLVGRCGDSGCGGGVAAAGAPPPSDDEPTETATPVAPTAAMPGELRPSAEAMTPRGCQQTPTAPPRAALRCEHAGECAAGANEHAAGAIDRGNSSAPWPVHSRSPCRASYRDALQRL